MGWCYVSVSLHGFSVQMAGPGICVLCLVDTCASDVYPVFNPVASYGYMLPNMYLYIADIVNPEDSFVVVGPGLVSTSPAFVRSSARHPAGPLVQKTVNGSTQFAQQFGTTVTAPPFVGCVVWNQTYLIIFSIKFNYY